jgi:hypothetical protein
MIAKPLKVRALENYSIHVEFSDGLNGVLDLSHLAGKGVFRDWDKDGLFAKVHIGACGAIEWNEDIDICPDNVYLQLRGLTFEQWQQQNRGEYAANQ